jgi:hypothetical protein
MKKTIFITVPIQKIDAVHYQVPGNPMLEYSGNVMSPINSVLAKTLKKDDMVKVVYVKEIQKQQNNNDELMKKELEKINNSIGAKIEFKTICKAFEETQKSHDEILESLIDELEEDTEVSADITYGTKPLPFIIFNVLTFAAKFCKADIINVVYGKVEYVKDSNGETVYENGKKKVENCTIFDLTPLYYLNSISSTIECNNMKEAKQTIKKFINM